MNYQMIRLSEYNHAIDIFEKESNIGFFYAPNDVMAALVFGISWQKSMPGSKMIRIDNNGGNAIVGIEVVVKRKPEYVMLRRVE